MIYKLTDMHKPPQGTAKIKNSKGDLIVLNQREQLLANMHQKVVNALGFEVNITTLTTIMKKISEQKFFEIAPADYLPMVVGEGAWSTNLVTYRSFVTGDDFATGVVNLGGNNSRLATTNAAVDTVVNRVFNWAKEIGWTLMEIETASKAGNWDLVTNLEESRKKNWDLGVQKTAFLGLDGFNGLNGAPSICMGLLNLPGVTVNLTTITKAISSMDTAELKAFVATVLNDYRANANRTAWPTHFIIPESDYLGLVSQASPDFPIKSTLELLEEAFQVATKNKGFKVLALAYADKAYNSLGVQKYVLLNYDEKSLRMNIPVDYTNTLANSLNNFNFQNAGYGQFTGAQALRPLEILYYQF